MNLRPAPCPLHPPKLTFHLTFICETGRGLLHPILLRVNMKLRFVILCFVIWLAPAKSFCSSPAYNLLLTSYDERFEVKQDDDTFIDNADLVDLIEDDILYIDEENSAGSNVNGRNSNRGGGKVFDPDNFLQRKWTLTKNCLFCAAYSFSSTPFPEVRTTPLFLLHRVFRI